MNIVIAVMALGLLASQAAAQEGKAAAVKAVLAKMPASLGELNKKHGQELADFKKKQAEALLHIKAGMKGKSAAEIKAAAEKQRAAGEIALKALKDSQAAEMAQFKKDHPEASGKALEMGKRGLKALPLPKGN